MKGELIPRDHYLEQLLSFREKQLIKIITGVRGCGKSYLFRIFIDELRSSGISAEQIVQINFEDYGSNYLTEPQALHEYLKSKLQDGKTIFLFLDEIQHVQGFERVLASLLSKGDVDIYLSSSNARVMHNEAATLLTGRFVNIKMLPLSISEYEQSKPGHKNATALYRSYLEYGSLPYVCDMASIGDVSTYHEGILSSIVMKDCLLISNIANVQTLFGILRYVCEHLGELLSPKRIASSLNDYGCRCDIKTVDKYLTSLIDAHVIYKASRLDVKCQCELSRLEKYYFVDHGLILVLLGRKDINEESFLENIIYLELIYRGYKVYVGLVEKTEVDFVAKSCDGIVYIQVSASVRDANTLARMLRPLQKIQDHYPKLLLTLDDTPDMTHDGILQTNALEWLLNH